MKKWFCLILLATIIMAFLTACSIMTEPTSTFIPTSSPIPMNTPTPTEVPDRAIVRRAEEIYDAVNRNGRLWPSEYHLTKASGASGIYSVRNINVASCEIGSRSSLYSTVVFKGNFSGYDEYGMFISKYSFTAEARCTIKNGSIDVDLVGADFKVRKS